MEVEARAAAGSKAFFADARFWRDVHHMFQVTTKDFTVDSIFQVLVGVGRLSFVYPTFAATRGHYSCRTSRYEETNPKLLTVAALV